MYKPRKVLIELSSDDHEIADLILRHANHTGQTYTDGRGVDRSHTITSVIRTAVTVGLATLAEPARNYQKSQGF